MRHKYNINFKLHHEFWNAALTSLVDFTPVKADASIKCKHPNAKFNLWTVKNPHSPVPVHVLPGQSIDLFAEYDIHDINEFTRSQTAYKSLVPREEDPNDDAVFETKLEQQPPKQDATNDPAILTGREITAPMICYRMFLVGSDMKIVCVNNNIYCRLLNKTRIFENGSFFVRVYLSELAQFPEFTTKS